MMNCANELLTISGSKMQHDYSERRLLTREQARTFLAALFGASSQASTILPIERRIFGRIEVLVVIREQGVVIELLATRSSTREELSRLWR